MRTLRLIFTLLLMIAATLPAFASNGEPGLSEPPITFEQTSFQVVAVGVSVMATLGVGFIFLAYLLFVAVFRFKKIGVTIKGFRLSVYTLIALISGFGIIYGVPNSEPVFDKFILVVLGINAALMILFWQIEKTRQEQRDKWLDRQATGLLEEILQTAAELGISLSHNIKRVEEVQIPGKIFQLVSLPPLARFLGSIIHYYSSSAPAIHDWFANALCRRAAEALLGHYSGYDRGRFINIAGARHHEVSELLELAVINTQNERAESAEQVLNKKTTHRVSKPYLSPVYKEHVPQLLEQ